MKDFKFFQRANFERTEPGSVKLKDPFNRDKYLFCNWSEYPENTYEGFIMTFQGNILEFYNWIQERSVYPTIYEIHKQYRGYHHHSLVYGNRNRHNQFISRKFYLTIKYSLL